MQAERSVSRTSCPAVTYATIHIHAHTHAHAHTYTEREQCVMHELPRRNISAYFYECVYTHVFYECVRACVYIQAEGSVSCIHMHIHIHTIRTQAEGSASCRSCPEGTYADTNTYTCIYTYTHRGRAVLHARAAPKEHTRMRRALLRAPTAVLDTFPWRRGRRNAHLVPQVTTYALKIMVCYTIYILTYIDTYTYMH